MGRGREKGGRGGEGVSGSPWHSSGSHLGPFAHVSELNRSEWMLEVLMLTMQWVTPSEDNTLKISISLKVWSSILSPPTVHRSLLAELRSATPGSRVRRHRCHISTTRSLVCRFFNSKAARTVDDSLPSNRNFSVYGYIYTSHLPSMYGIIDWDIIREVIAFYSNDREHDLLLEVVDGCCY